MLEGTLQPPEDGSKRKDRRGSFRSPQRRVGDPDNKGALKEERELTLSEDLLSAQHWLGASVHLHLPNICGGYFCPCCADWRQRVSSETELLACPQTGLYLPTPTFGDDGALACKWEQGCESLWFTCDMLGDVVSRDSGCWVHMAWVFQGDR